MLKDSQVDLCGRTDFTRTAPLLARDEAFSFACAGRNAPQVKARQHDILPPPAAAAAARAGKRKRLVPGKQGRGAGKIGAAAEIDL